MPTSFGRGGAWISWLVEALSETVMVDASGVGRERRAGFVCRRRRKEEKSAVLSCECYRGIYRGNEDETRSGYYFHQNVGSYHPASAAHAHWSAHAQRPCARGIGRPLLRPLRSISRSIGHAEAVAHSRQIQCKIAYQYTRRATTTTAIQADSFFVQASDSPRSDHWTFSRYKKHVRHTPRLTRTTSHSQVSAP